MILIIMIIQDIEKEVCLGPFFKFKHSMFNKNIHIRLFDYISQYFAQT